MSGHDSEQALAPVPMEDGHDDEGGLKTNVQQAPPPVEEEAAAASPPAARSTDQPLLPLEPAALPTAEAPATTVTSGGAGAEGGGANESNEAAQGQESKNNNATAMALDHIQQGAAAAIGNAAAAAAAAAATTISQQQPPRAQQQPPGLTTAYLPSTAATPSTTATTTTVPAPVPSGPGTAMTAAAAAGGATAAAQVQGQQDDTAQQQANAHGAAAAAQGMAGLGQGHKAMAMPQQHQSLPAQHDNAAMATAAAAAYQQQSVYATHPSAVAAPQQLPQQPLNQYAAAYAMNPQQQLQLQQQHFGQQQAAYHHQIQQQQQQQQLQQQQGVAPLAPKEQDAVGYLHQIKIKFAHEPSVYNRFLDIMKSFQNMTIDTSGVIQRVKELFHGDHNLILGFNQFLPPGYKIELEEIEREERMDAAAVAANVPMTVAARGAVPPNANADGGGALAPPRSIDFDHAFQYVARIKQRFIDQPEVYSQFLDLLQDYQAQRTIDEIYSRVTHLFRNDQDLLEEFSYFLPDAAPPPLETTATTTTTAIKQQKKGKGKKRSRSEANNNNSNDNSAVPPSEPDVYDDEQARIVTVKYPVGSEKEIQFFEKLKQSLPRRHWGQFIKVLNLFANAIITRVEMVRLVGDILSDRSEKMDRFKNAIGFDDWEETQILTDSHLSYHAYVSSAELMSCPQVTPSYRELPEEIQFPTTSGRTPLCESELSDRYISTPTGSEDFSFKSTRKNEFEENLFKCEDERFELDMCIENNAAAIRVLEPVVVQLSALSEEQAKRVKLSRDVHILHIRAVARLYGEQGYEVVEMLKRSPAVVAPIVLERLKQKDEEWRCVKQDLKAGWRKINQNNYYRSLDHRSFYFKQEDRKRRLAKSLMSELMEHHQRVFEPSAKKKRSSQSSNISRDTQGVETLDSEALRRKLLDESENKPVYTYCMKFGMKDQSIHEQMYEAVSRVAARELSDADEARFHSFWAGFVHHFFNVRVNSSSGDKARMKDSHMNGVQTAAGLGNSHPVVGMNAPRDDIGLSGSGLPEGSEQDAVSSDELPTAFSYVQSPVSSVTAGAKPVRVSMKAWERDEKVHPVRRHCRSSKLFFGDERFYTFFRLHQFVYDRLMVARKLAFEEPTKAMKARLKTETGEDLTAEMRYARFGEILFEMLAGDMEVEPFEDECRTLLGSSSYCLFTMDRLLSQIVNFVPKLVTTSRAVKLLQLYRYEFSRSQELEELCKKLPPATVEEQAAEEALAGAGASVSAIQDACAVMGAARGHMLDTSAQLARMYHGNCMTLLGGKSVCVQFEYFNDTSEICMGLTYRPTAFELNSISEECLEYLDAIVVGKRDPILDRLPDDIGAGQPPVMKRNLKLCRTSDRGSASVKRARHKYVEESCTLEAKISNNTYQMHFVEGGELVYVRHRHRPRVQEGVGKYQSGSKAAASWLSEFHAKHEKTKAAANQKRLEGARERLAELLEEVKAAMGRVTRASVAQGKVETPLTEHVSMGASGAGGDEGVDKQHADAVMQT